jgi:hypothetical protein
MITLKDIQNKEHYINPLSIHFAQMSLQSDKVPTLSLIQNYQFYQIIKGLATHPCIIWLILIQKD